MRARFASYGALVLDVPSIVTQMDQTVWALKAAWQQLNAKWSVMLTDQEAQSADARLKTLATLISDLDVGGVAREHVFFPVDGQTSEEAWATYNETAVYVRNGLMQLGGFISNWSLSAVLPRIAGDVGNELKTDLTWVGVAIAAVAVLSIAGFVGNAKRGFSGYPRRRKVRR